MKLPVRLISFALRTPSDLRQEDAHPAAGHHARPDACVSANAARSDATRKSHASASSKPPVTHGPLIAPITGLVIFHERGERASRRDRRAPPTRFDRVAAELAQVEAGAERGIGAGEDHDVDVVVGSAAASAAPVARCSATLSALRASGRFSVTVRTRSAVSVRSRSVMS